jgi:hypothetical protein
MMNAPSWQERVVKKSKFTEEHVAFAPQTSRAGYAY